MAEKTAFDQIVHFGREAVQKSHDFIGEKEAPLYNFFRSKPTQKLTERGYRIPIKTSIAGGYTWFDRSNVDFRTPVSAEGDSMRVFPTWVALPYKLDGTAMRLMMQGDEDQFLKYGEYMKDIGNDLKKRINKALHGDGTGALAVCGSVITGNGSTTLTCLTLASSGAGEAETKGGVNLKLNHVYAIINASTNAIKCTFTVTAESRTAPTVTVANHAANTASGDPVVDLGSTTSLSAYKKYPEGLRSLCANSGVLQQVPRTTYPDLKSQRVNGNDLPVTPFLYNNAKALVNIAANDMNEAQNRVIVCPIGQDAALRAQQWGYRRYEGNETVKGVAGKFVDADGDQNIFDSDAAEDRIYFLDGGSYALGIEMPFGDFDADGNSIRMLPGANNAGSDAYYGAIGMGMNLMKKGLPRCDAYIDRLSQTDIPGQTSL